MRYDVLNQRNPCYLADQWQELQDLYEGGYTIAARAEKYLPQLVGERPDRWKERCKITAYIGYLGQVIDYFAAALFEQEIIIAPAADAADTSTPGVLPDERYYTAFAQNADLQKTSFAQLLKKAFTTAILKERAVIGIDFPKSSVLPISRAEEDAMGAARAYAYEVPIEQIIDWKRDDHGNFEWAILHRCIQERDTPASDRGVITEQFKIWEEDPTGGPARWSLFEIKYKVEEPPNPEQDIPLVDQGVSSFASIPLVELTVPFGLWIGNKIGGLAKEHFQRRSALIAGQNKSLLAIPVAKLGPEIGPIGGAIPAQVTQNPARGDNPVSQFNNRGYVTIGKDDDLYFAEPEGKAFAITDKQLGDLKDEIFRIVYQMAASVTNKASSLSRSGESKKKDGEITAIVLGAFGELVREFGKKIYGVISVARKENVIWVAHGLDNYNTEAREDLITEGTQMDMINIPSPTFVQTYKISIAKKLTPGLPPDTQETIRQEIIDGVKADYDRKQKMKAQELKDAIAPKPPPGPPQAGPPGAGKPPPGKPSNPGAPVNKAA